MVELPKERSSIFFKYIQVKCLICSLLYFKLKIFISQISVANTNGFASIMIRVSSTENTEHQHLIMNKFEPENNNTDMTHKTKLNQKKRNQHK